MLMVALHLKLLRWEAAKGKQKAAKKRMVNAAAARRMLMSAPLMSLLRFSRLLSARKKVS